ncbi:hypothetical protein QJS10_CPB14g00314 [Acorus calamus]|uniref:Uncharacterized protein n=1 Tax=Acorus calamus TaxID=4465 RepID=A0AAV9DBJ6_ACOCL|nr:hypothetical protein QJS10_CPB14g00314 [Acorus calamus]
MEDGKFLNEAAALGKLITKADHPQRLESNATQKREFPDNNPFKKRRTLGDGNLCPREHTPNKTMTKQESVVRDAGTPNEVLCEATTEQDSVVTDAGTPNEVLCEILNTQESVVSKMTKRTLIKKGKSERKSKIKNNKTSGDSSIIKFLTRT